MPNKKLTKQEMQTLYYLLENAQRRMNQEVDAWPTAILGHAIHEMWSGFWAIIPPHMITEVRG
jgi:hypothetical protein